MLRLSAKQVNSNMVDPAKHLKKHQKENKKYPIWKKLDNTITTLIISFVVMFIGYLTKDFVLEWVDVLMEAIQ
jgi:hypothetical protein